MLKVGSEMTCIDGPPRRLVMREVELYIEFHHGLGTQNFFSYMYYMAAEINNLEYCPYTACLIKKFVSIVHYTYEHVHRLEFFVTLT